MVQKFALCFKLNILLLGERNLAMNNNKIAYISNLRVFACMGVILCHVAANNWYGNIESERWIVLTVYSAFSRYSVPVFLMISGALFLKTEKEISFRRIYLHNISKLMVFLVFWGTCYQIYNLVVVQGKLHGEGVALQITAEAIRNVLRGETQAHLWYIYIIIGLYMVVPLLKSWVNSLNRKQIEYFLVLFLMFNGIYSILCNFNNGIIGNLCSFCSKLSINIVGGYVGYLILGYYLSTYDFSSKVRKVCYIIGIFSFVICTAFTIIYSRYVGAAVEIFWNYLGVFVVFWSISVFMFFRYNIDKSYNKLDFIADYTLGIYACHMLVVFEIWRKGISTFSFNSIVSVPFIVVVVFFCSLCFTFFLSKIPFIKKWLV